jgi:uncharacterized lipoprotein YbaY
MPGENMSKAKADTESTTFVTAPESAPAPSEFRPVPNGTATSVGQPEPKMHTFRDKVYTSRTLILPDGASLAVAKHRVTVEDSNVQALAYLKAHEEFEPLE